MKVCEDLSDLLPDSVSSFAQLFAEPKAMETWTAFVQASEEEQERILAGPQPKEENKLGGRKMDGRKGKYYFSPSHSGSWQSYRDRETSATQGLLKDSLRLM